MKRLYTDEYEVHTDDGNEFCREVEKSLYPIVKKWVDNGYSVREILSSLVMSSTAITSELALKRAMNKRKENKRADNQSK